ncbi:MAG: hypothetical protein SGPRY_006156 [Prymnesium sp.]
MGGGQVDPDTVQFSSAGEDSPGGQRGGAEGVDFIDSHTVDLRLATEGMAVLLIVSRRNRASRGVSFLWCTLAALTGTALWDASARCLLATQAFVKPMSVLEDAQFASGAGQPLEFRTGITRSVSLIGRPLLDSESSPSFWRVMSQALEAEQLIREALTSSANAELESWLAAIRPMPFQELPHGLIAHLADFNDECLDSVALPPTRMPDELPWVPLPPSWKLSPSAPPCPLATDMLMPGAWVRLREWVDAQVKDLLHIQERLRAGTPPQLIPREGRPRAITIGQSEFQPWARDVVWDCRQRCCAPLEASRIPESGLSRDVMREWWHHYPDQALLSYLLEGVRLEADVELQLVLVPHLTSLPMGFTSVEKELRRLHGLGWYHFFASLPFMPMYCNGQGAVAWKLEPDRFRRSTEGGGPRQLSVDASGLPAISINEASRIPHVPQHFLRDERAEFHRWLEARGLREKEVDGPAE